LLLTSAHGRLSPHPRDGRRFGGGKELGDGRPRGARAPGAPGSSRAQAHEGHCHRELKAACPARGRQEIGQIVVPGITAPKTIPATTPARSPFRNPIRPSPVCAKASRESHNVKWQRGGYSALSSHDFSIAKGNVARSASPAPSRPRSPTGSGHAPADCPLPASTITNVRSHLDSPVKYALVLALASCGRFGFSDANVTRLDSSSVSSPRPAKRFRRFLQGNWSNLFRAL
jgi:hypothetical protein